MRDSESAEKLGASSLPEEAAPAADSITALKFDSLSGV